MFRKTVLYFVTLRVIELSDSFGVMIGNFKNMNIQYQVFQCVKLNFFAFI